MRAYVSTCVCVCVPEDAPQHYLKVRKHSVPRVPFHFFLLAVFISSLLFLLFVVVCVQLAVLSIFFFSSFVDNKQKYHNMHLSVYLI